MKGYTKSEKRTYILFIELQVNPHRERENLQTYDGKTTSSRHTKNRKNPSKASSRSATLKYSLVLDSKKEKKMIDEL